MKGIKCRYCGKEYSNKGIHHHEKFCSCNPNPSDRSYLRQNGLNTCKKLRKNPRQKVLYTFICERCGKEYTKELSVADYKAHRYPRYCSRSCANVREHSTETREKISNTLTHTTSITICKGCGCEYNRFRDLGTKLYCKKCHDNGVRVITEETRNKLSESGRKSISLQGDARRSKNEKLFCELCEARFNQVLHNKPMFDGWDADVILPEYKVAVLWNGIWHYEQISKTSSLKQIQKRDEIKLRKIKESGYTPYIIIDKGKYNPSFVKEQFEVFVNNLNIAG